MANVQNSCVPTSDYRDLPVAQLVESPTNPRKRFDEASLQELAGSIQAQGILAPLLVREIAQDSYEIVAGSRRYRAAVLAGSSTVPVRVVQLNDAEAILAQVVENLQRENVHPLEEAYGFRLLLDLPDHQFNVAAIAAKAGKSAQYVAQRLKLTELIPTVADAFLADKLTIGHALLIAKLPPAQQADALKAAFKTTWMSGGDTQILIPVRELAGWIESNLLLDLQTAPFDRSDATLVPEAGSCHECPKRTGANTLLFPETDRDQCLDRDCYQGKLNAHIAASITRDPELIQISSTWGTHSNGILGRGQYVEVAVAKSGRNGRRGMLPEQKKCHHIRKAIVVEGGSPGQVLNVCAEPTCEMHHAENRKARESQEKMRTEQRKQEERRKQQLATRSRVLAAILEKVSAPLTKADLELVAREFANRLPQDFRAILIERHSTASANTKQPKKTADQGTTFNDLDEAGYSRLLVEMSLLDATHNPFLKDGADRLGAVAKRYRVNAQKIAESVASEFALRSKRKAERQKAATNRNRNGSRKVATKASRA
jgi:ParB family transcriptional regulator, chromosome partitioning protein